MDEGNGEITKQEPTKQEPAWLGNLINKLPFEKLTRHDVTNLTFDAIAIGYTIIFARNLQNESLSVATWLSVIILSLVCVLWISKI